MARTLLQKLGIKENFSIHLINAPLNYAELLEDPLPKGVTVVNKLAKDPVDFVHFFTNNINEFEARIPELQSQIVQNGMIWISWHKKSSKLNSELTEDIIRNTALALKLVDVKVCAVNEIWSALKLVIRLSHRVV